MKEVKAKLLFQGAIKKGEENYAPAENGIYVAFACTFNTSTAKWHPERIVYIGKAEGTDTIKKRISDHVNNRDEADSGKQSYWEKNYVKAGETIIYTYATQKSDLHDIEAVLLYLNDVKANINGTGNYLADADVVDVTCEGNRGTLRSSNVMKKEK